MSLKKILKSVNRDVLKTSRRQKLNVFAFSSLYLAKAVFS